MQEQYYELPTELSMSKYVVTNKGTLLKKKGNLDLKEVKIDSRGYSRYTDDFGVQRITTFNVLIGIYNRINGKYNNRKRLPFPFENYECKRDGTFYRFDNPEEPLLVTYSDIIRLRRSDTSEQVDVSSLDVVCKLFVYKIELDKFFDHFLVTNVNRLCKLTTNPRGYLNHTYLSQKNTCLVLNKHHGKHLVILNGLPKYVADKMTGEIFNGVTDESLSFSKHPIDGTTRKIYNMLKYDYKTNSYLNSKFYVTSDENSAYFVNWLK